nr:hypothetical protein GCM10025730_19710 [Promicromonospora thailandica]
MREVVERLGGGLTTSLLGKPVLDESLPYHCGVMGHLGTTASADLMAGCDTLLIVGSNDPWTEYYPAPGQARAVQVDVTGRNIGTKYPVEEALVGDAAATLDALLPLLPRRTGWRDQVEGFVSGWHDVAGRRVEQRSERLNPQHVVSELSARLPSDAQVAVDVGSVTYWYARFLRLPEGVPAHLSSTLASMGSAMPYGIAAKLLHPDRPVVALAGDGAMQMNGLSELITVAHRWRDWADPRFVVLVLHNGDLAEVSWEQREMEGDPRFPVSQTVPDFPYADYARLLGLEGIRVDDPGQVGEAWSRALAADRPVLVEAVVDPDVPLLPPRQEAEKVEQTLDALAQEPDGGQAAALLREQRAGSEPRPQAARRVSSGSCTRDRLVGTTSASTRRTCRAAGAPSAPGSASPARSWAATLRRSAPAVAARSVSMVSASSSVSPCTAISTPRACSIVAAEAIAPSTARRASRATASRCSGVTSATWPTSSGPDAVRTACPDTMRVRVRPCVSTMRCAQVKGWPARSARTASWTTRSWSSGCLRARSTARPGLTSSGSYPYRRYTSSDHHHVPVASATRYWPETTGVPAAIVLTRSPARSGTAAGRASDACWAVVRAVGVVIGASVIAVRRRVLTPP